MMSTVPMPPAEDRSVPRRRRKAGDASRDGRGRVTSMPPILQYGFRPFFFLAALHAGLAIPAWLWMYFTGHALPGPFPGLEWHVHEMLFGYLAAVLTGFILTAIPNWTGRLPLSGWPLAGLVVLWLAGRIACAMLTDPLSAMAVDIAFPGLLAFAAKLRPERTGGMPPSRRWSPCSASPTPCITARTSAFPPRGAGRAWRSPRQRC